MAAHRLTDGTRIGCMTIGRHLFWSMADHINCLLAQIAALPPYFASHSPWNPPNCHRGRSLERGNTISHALVPVRFIDMPGFPGLATPLGSQLISYQGSKPRFPVSEGFVGERKTACSKHLSNVTQTAFLAQPPEDRKQDSVRWECKGVEWCASPFMKDAMTVRTEGRSRATFGFLCSLLGRRSLPIRTVHQSTLLVHRSFLG